MSYFFPPRQSSQIIKLDGHEIMATEIELLDRHRTVYRFKLEPGSYRHTIPKTATSVIIKQQKDEWEEEFKDEQRAYNRLKKLQGKVIPYFYGRGHFDGRPALVLSDVDRITLDELARSNYEVPEETLRSSLEEVFSEFSKHGALYRDQKLDNFLLCDGKGREKSRVMVVDLEQVVFPEHLRPWQHSINQEKARCLMEEFRYRRNPGRESSPLEFWMSGHDKGVSLSELNDFARDLSRKSWEACFYHGLSKIEEEGTLCHANMIWHWFHTEANIVENEPQ